MTRLATGTALAMLAASMLLAGCEPGAKQTEQTGYRGTGMAQIADPDNYMAPGEVPPPPYDLPPPGGVTAAEAYQNVQVLGHLSKDEFDYTMAAITQWIAPAEGCNYCHNPANLADDSLYTKNVARRMIQMTQNVNENWTEHVQQTGVTCYTCHRGNAVPKYVWTNPEEGNSRTITGNRHGQNGPNPSVAYASLPTGGFARYFSGGGLSAKVSSATIHPTPANMQGTRAAEDTYGIMMHLSQALNVNCTFCHNSQAFRAYNVSTPKRALALYGINMVRTINGEYIEPLAPVFPANRLGPGGDPYKVNCASCHQQQRKPLGGVSMVADYPGLQRLAPAPDLLALPPEEDAAAPAEGPADTAADQ